MVESKNPRLSPSVITPHTGPTSPAISNTISPPLHLFDITHSHHYYLNSLQNTHTHTHYFKNYPYSVNATVIFSFLSSILFVSREVNHTHNSEMIREKIFRLHRHKSSSSYSSAGTDASAQKFDFTFSNIQANQVGFLCFLYAYIHYYLYIYNNSTFFLLGKLVSFDSWWWYLGIFIAVCLFEADSLHMFSYPYSSVVTWAGFEFSTTRLSFVFVWTMFHLFIYFVTEEIHTTIPPNFTV